MELGSYDEALLAGTQGEAPRLAMDIVVKLAQSQGATRLENISTAHIDGCLYNGQVGLDFAERLTSLGARVAVPTTLNVGSLDLLHPGLYRGEAETARKARQLMEAYRSMGCEPTWTCAPYQLRERPGFGEHIAWAESNAIVFANSVLGARTERYGDFIDICAAITGRVPYSGLHLTENRRGQILFRLSEELGSLPERDVFYPVLGHLIGAQAGGKVPVIQGLPSGVSEDRLKALGAAAASSGSVALFHAVGITPEAASLKEALGAEEPDAVIDVTAEMVRSARDSLTTASSTEVSAVSLGTPHFSIEEFAELVPLLQQSSGAHPGVGFYVSTARQTLAELEARGWVAICERAGGQLVVDTCTYVTPILGRTEGAVMTNSAKWAYYAPGNIGVEVVFGSLEECVRSAEEGRVWRDEGLWGSV